MSNRISTNGQAKITIETKAKAPVKVKAQSKATKKQRKLAAAVIGGAGLVMLAHCQEAVMLLTGAGSGAALAMAIAIDVTMCGAEWAELLHREDEHMLKYLCWAVIVTSAAMNMMIFTRHATNTGAAGALGLVVPALILGAFRIAGHLVK